MDYENLFDILAHLDPEKKAALVAACRGMGLSDVAIEGVEQSARMLRHFESFGKPYIRSPKALQDSLGKIATLSYELRQAILEAGHLDKLEIHQHMEEAGLIEGLTWPSHVPLGGVVDYLGVALERMENAASAVQRQSEQRGSKGGRNKLHHRYCIHLNWAWESVKDEGFKLGRGGRFQTLCDAIFLAAGVPATSAGAVRFFVENKKKIETEQASRLASLVKSVGTQSAHGQMARARIAK